MTNCLKTRNRREENINLWRGGIRFSIVWLLLLVSLVHARGQAVEQTRLVVQTGHSSGVTSVAFSPDGKTLASGGWDNIIKFWEVASGHELRALVGHSSHVTALAFSPDGKTLASGSWDKTIKLWDVASGQELKTLTGHSNYVNAVAFSADGKTLASGSDDKTIKLWDTASGRELRKLEGHFRGVYSVAFSPNGKTLASGSDDMNIKLWDATSGQELRQLTGHSDGVRSLAFGANGDVLASGSFDKTIKLWEVSSGQELRQLKGHSSYVTSVAFSPDGKTLASGSWDKTIKLWEVAGGRELQTLTRHSDIVRSVAFSPDGKTLASGSWDKTIKLWQTASGQELRTLAGHSSFVTSVVFSPDGKTLASGNWSNTVKLWELSSGRELRTLAGHSRIVESVAFSPDGKMLASGSYDKTIKLWEVSSGQELRTLAGHSNFVESVAFSPDGKTLASGSWDKTIKLWEVASGQELRTLSGHSDVVRSVSFSPDGKMLASGSWDKTIKLWEVATGRELRTLAAHSDRVTSVAFSSDGQTLASGSWDKTVKLWAVASGQELRTLTGHSQGIYSVAFRPDGKTLASGSEDKTIKLWDVASGQELRTQGGQWDVYSVAFSPDGNILAGGSAGARIRLWNRAGEELSSLIALDANDWAVVTPKGFFDASPGGRKLLHYVVGMEVVTLEQMKEGYYVPGLLQKAVAGAPLPNVELFTAQDLFPEAKYEQLKPGQQTFIVKLRNRGGGIGPAQVMVNGTEVIADARPPGFDPQANEATLTIDLSNVRQLLPGQENRVEVIARNADGFLSSKGSARGATVVFVGAGNASTDPPELYAIIGGVSKYVDDKLDLHYSGKDAADFAWALGIGATTFLGQGHVHIRLLTTEKTEHKEPFTVSDYSQLPPSKENFQKVFGEFAAKAKQNDILVVFLSGHGVAINLNTDPRKPVRDSYLYLSQEAYTTDSSILMAEKIRTATTVSSDELAQWIRDIPAAKKALVLDTCAAGAADISFAGKELPPDQKRALERLKDRTGFFVLMGSAADKVSYETTTYHQGLLTYSLLEGLKGGNLREARYADVGLLFNYSHDRVPRLAQSIGQTQQPLFLNPDSGGSFDIGLYTEAEQKLIHLPSPSPIVLHPSLRNKETFDDELGLQAALQRALLEASYVNTRGPSMFFIDAPKMQDAFEPSGSYTVAGDKVTINFHLTRNGVRGTAFTVEGTVADEPSKAALVQKLIAAISDEIQKITKKTIH